MQTYSCPYSVVGLLLLLHIDSRGKDNDIDIQKFTTMGSFTNYIDIILAFFLHTSCCVDIFYGMKKSGQFKTTYLTGLVNVVCK